MTDLRNRDFSRERNSRTLAGFERPRAGTWHVLWSEGVSNGGPDPYAWPVLSTEPVLGAFMLGDTRSGSVETNNDFVPVGEGGLQTLRAQNVTQGTPVGSATTVGSASVPAFTVLSNAEMAPLTDPSVRVWGENYMVAAVREFLRLGKMKGASQGPVVVGSNTLGYSPYRLASLLDQLGDIADGPVRLLGTVYTGGEVNYGNTLTELKDAYETSFQMNAAIAETYDGLQSVRFVGQPTGAFAKDRKQPGNDAFSFAPVNAVLELADEVPGFMQIGPHIQDKHRGDDGHLSAQGAVAFGTRLGAIFSHVYHDGLEWFGPRIIEVVTEGTTTTVHVAAESVQAVLRDGDGAMVTGKGFSGRDGLGSGDTLTASTVAIDGTVITITWNRAPDVDTGGLYHAGELSGGVTNIMATVAGVPGQHPVAAAFLPWNYRHPFLGEASSGAPEEPGMFPDHAAVTNSPTGEINFGNSSGPLYVMRAITLTAERTVRKIGVARTSAGTVYVGVAKRISAGSYQIVALESYAHGGGNDREDHVLATPFEIPSDGATYHPCAWIGGNAYGVTSAARAYATTASPALGSISMTEDTNTSPGIWVN